VPALGALAAVLLAGAIGVAAWTGASTTSPPDRSPALRPTSGAALAGLTARHRPAVAVDSVAASPSAAGSAAPPSPEPYGLLAVAIAAVALAALLGVRLGRRHGSTPTLPGTGSMSTRGPPVLQPA
jgi:hypothetical protein